MSPVLEQGSDQIRGRFLRWWRRHETPADVLGLMLFLVVALGEATPDTPTDIPPLGFAAGLVAPLVLRRRFPRGVFATIASVALLQWVLGFGLMLADAGVLLGMHVVASRCRLVWAFAALATALLGVGLVIARIPGASWDDWRVVAFYSTIVLIFWVTGRYANIRRRYLAGVEERAQRLERERDARATAAVAEERAHIARELHDVVAHHVGVMVVQADGAAFILDSDPARAQAAVQTVSTTGRTALSEMRRMLGMLRASEHPPDYEPQPGLDQLDELFARVRGAGLPVRYTVNGPAQQVPAGMQLAVYRVVQEALTNTLNHAGPGASSAEVELTYTPDCLQIRVVDDGQGPPTAGAASEGSGHGLFGMHERVTMYGGRAQAGPRAAGGYEVVASLPLPPPTP